MEVGGSRTFAANHQPLKKEIDSKNFGQVKLADRKTVLIPPTGHSKLEK